MNNEITVKLKCSVSEIQDILKRKDFDMIDKYEMEDTYYISKDVDINELSPREILKSYILIRNIKQYEAKQFINSYNIIKLTYKHKNIAQNGDIISQEKEDCEIRDIQQGERFLKAIGYKKLMKLQENDIVYGKDDLKIEIKSVENGENLIEIETIEDNKALNTIDKLKRKIIELDLPIDKSNFFVKKAEIKLKKILGDLK